MKCFEVVQRVLEDTYGEIPGEETERDQAITTALSEMSNRYATALLTHGGPSFDSPQHRFAYVYCYVPAHAHWICELIGWSREAQEILARDEVRVACIGGGPGSDLVGVLKYLDNRQLRPRVFCEIVDGCIDWKKTWSDVAFKLGLDGMSLHTDYVVQTVGSGTEWKQPHNFRKAELVTLNFFFSEIAHLGTAATDYIASLFDMLKPGAIVLFNDNDASNFYGPFDGLAHNAGLQVLHSGHETRKVYDRAEQVSEVGRFKAKFNRAPRLTGRVASRILRKP